jgi:hypothetical protein
LVLGTLPASSKESADVEVLWHATGRHIRLVPNEHLS